MCDFQDRIFLKADKRRRIGYKVVSVATNVLTGPYQRTQYNINVWNIAGGYRYNQDDNPGFCIFKTRKDAVQFLNDRKHRFDYDTLVIVKVQAKVIMSSSPDGFCAMKMFISKTAANRAFRTVSRRLNG